MGRCSATEDGFSKQPFCMEDEQSVLPYCRNRWIRQHINFPVDIFSPQADKDADECYYLSQLQWAVASLCGKWPTDSGRELLLRIAPPSSQRSGNFGGNRQPAHILYSWGRACNRRRRKVRAVCSILAEPGDCCSKGGGNARQAVRGMSGENTAGRI